MALANIYEYMLSSSEDEDFMEIIHRQPVPDQEL